MHKAASKKKQYHNSFWKRNYLPEDGIGDKCRDKMRKVMRWYDNIILPGIANAGILHNGSKNFGVNDCLKKYGIGFIQKPIIISEGDYEQLISIMHEWDWNDYLFTSLKNDDKFMANDQPNR